MRLLSSLKAAEVLHAVRELMPEHGRVESHSLLVPVADRLGAAYDLANPRWDFLERSAHQAARERLAGQVVRALNKLAADGTLRKAGQDELLPGGGTAVGRTAYWYTHEEWVTCEAEAAKREAQAQAERDRLAKISERAGALSVLIPDPASPSPHALEQLLDLAEEARGTGRAGSSHDTREGRR